MVLVVELVEAVVVWESHAPKHKQTRVNTWLNERAQVQIRHGSVFSRFALTRSNWFSMAPALLNVVVVEAVVVWESHATKHNHTRINTWLNNYA